MANCVLIAVCFNSTLVPGSNMLLVASSLMSSQIRTGSGYVRNFTGEQVVTLEFITAEVT